MPTPSNEQEAAYLHALARDIVTNHPVCDWVMGYSRQPITMVQRPEPVYLKNKIDNSPEPVYKSNHEAQPNKNQTKSRT